MEGAKQMNEHTLKVISEFNDLPDLRITLINLLDECKELDPLLPIESAPKDKHLLLGTKHISFTGLWNTTENIWVDDSGELRDPTNYKLLTEDTKE